MSKSRGPSNAGVKVSTRQPPKAPQRATKKVTANLEAVGEASEMQSTNNVLTVADNAAPVVKPKGRGGAKKAPAAATKKASISEDDDDDEEMADLKERLARYNLESSPENSTGMDFDAPQARATTKEPSKRAAATKKKTVITLSETSDKEGGQDGASDEDG
ncbi:hypothetical protein SAY87_010172 [Trapa incisa]|uniref:Uncharacterized protein n=1 Tax=Trapa incisa TaxID=236973 RepID=A0AAN7JHX6_9MYRT|nr:hypothetical protein SAY87_010172 [Trapa incisa]